MPAPGLATNLRAPALIAWMARRGPHVVHTHSGAWLKGARAARAAGVPGGRAHGARPARCASRGTRTSSSGARPRRRAPSSPFPTRCAATCCSSTRLSPSEVRTIPNGIDTRAFSPELPDSRARLLPGSDGHVVVGCVARFEPVKNHDLLLRAFREAHRARPELLLVLVGDGSLRPELEALARSLEIAHAVRFAGDQPDPASWYRCFDAFVLASRAEGTSMSLLEAMASGCLDHRHRRRRQSGAAGRGRRRSTGALGGRGGPGGRAGAGRARRRGRTRGSHPPRAAGPCGCTARMRWSSATSRSTVR